MMYFNNSKLLTLCLLLGLQLMLSEGRFQLSEDENSFYATGLSPEAYMLADELITSKGIPLEHYYVQTSDGYILEMHRLARPDSNQTYPVLLMPGLMGSSESFLINPRNQSLAYVLYDRGFDVFLGNARGTRYATNHTTLNPDEDDKFWDFTFDDIGNYDVPALVDRVLEVTGKIKLNYVGYCEGAVVLFSAVIQHHALLRRTNPPFGAKIDKFFALGPAVYVKHSEANLVRVRQQLEGIKEQNAKFHGKFIPFLNVYRLLFVKLFQRIIPNFLMPHVMKPISGKGDAKHYDAERYAVIFQKELMSTSVKNIEHWLQLFDHDRNFTHVGMNYYHNNITQEYLRMYSHRNLINIVSRALKEYNFNLFWNIPTYFFCGGADALVTLEDCKAASTIVKSLQEVITVDGFAHLDLAFSPHAAEKIYNVIINRIETEENPYY